MTLEEYTCELFGCTVDEIFSKTRLREVVSARAVCMSVMREYTGMSLMQIGKHFGKDHATVLHSLRTVRNLYSSDRSYRAIVDKVYDACRLSSLVIPHYWDNPAEAYLDEDMSQILLAV